MRTPRPTWREWTPIPARMPPGCRPRPSPIASRCSRARTASSCITSVRPTPTETSLSCSRTRAWPMSAICSQQRRYRSSTRSTGGSGVAFPETLAKAVAGIDGVAGVITGHSPFPPTYAGRGRREPPGTRRWAGGLMTWDDLAEYADFTRDLLAAVETAFEAGQNVDDAVAALALPPPVPGLRDGRRTRGRRGNLRRAGGPLIDVQRFVSVHGLVGLHLNGTAANHFPQLIQIAVSGPSFFCGDVDSAARLFRVPRAGRESGKAELRKPS